MDPATVFFYWTTLAVLVAIIAVACRWPIDIEWRDATDEEKEKWG